MKMYRAEEQRAVSSMHESMDPAPLERKKHGLLDDEEVANLSSAILTTYEPPLTKVKQQLLELTRKQEVLGEQLGCEKQRLELSQSQANLQETFSKVRIYHGKLVALKKDMAQLHERSTKLKKRGLRLQEQRQKEALQRELNRERELQREQQLIQPPSSSSTQLH